MEGRATGRVEQESAHPALQDVMTGVKITERARLPEETIMAERGLHEEMTIEDGHLHPTDSVIAMHEVGQTIIGQEREAPHQRGGKIYREMICSEETLHETREITATFEMSAEATETRETRETREDMGVREIEIEDTALRALRHLKVLGIVVRSR